MAREHRREANGHRYREAKKRFVQQAEPLCAICGKFVDKSLKFPHPGSPSVDHIVPLAAGGHATDRTNWQLTCLGCNRWKSDKITVDPAVQSRIGCQHPHHLSRQHYAGQEVERCPARPNLWHHMSYTCACSGALDVSA